MTIVPRLLERYKAMVLDLPGVARKDPARARMLLRRLIGGPLRLVPENGALVAEFKLTGERMALVAGAIPEGRDKTGGAGGGT